MERLTRPNGNYCDDCGSTKDKFCACDEEIAMYERLRAYENAESQGRLIMLPCEVGTEVWSAAPFVDNVPRKGYITAFLVSENGAYSFYVSFDSEPISAEFLIDDIDKTVIVSRGA